MTVKPQQFMGNALIDQDKVDEAIAHPSQALRIRPDFAEARNKLRRARRQAGQ